MRGGGRMLGVILVVVSCRPPPDAPAVAPGSTNPLDGSPTAAVQEAAAPPSAKSDADRDFDWEGFRKYYEFRQRIPTADPNVRTEHEFLVPSKLTIGKVESSDEGTQPPPDAMKVEVPN